MIEVPSPSGRSMERRACGSPSRRSRKTHPCTGSGSTAKRERVACSSVDGVSRSRTIVIGLLPVTFMPTTAPAEVAGEATIIGSQSGASSLRSKATRSAAASSSTRRANWTTLLNVPIGEILTVRTRSRGRPRTSRDRGVTASSRWSTRLRIAPRTRLTSSTGRTSRPSSGTTTTSRGGTSTSSTTLRSRRVAARLRAARVPRGWSPGSGPDVRRRGGLHAGRGSRVPHRAVDVRDRTVRDRPVRARRPDGRWPRWSWIAPRHDRQGSPAGRSRFGQLHLAAKRLTRVGFSWRSQRRTGSIRSRYTRGSSTRGIRSGASPGSSHHDATREERPMLGSQPLDEGSAPTPAGANSAPRRRVGSYQPRGLPTWPDERTHATSGQR